MESLGFVIGFWDPKSLRTLKPRRLILGGLYEDPMSLGTLKFMMFILNGLFKDKVLETFELFGP